MVNLSTMGAEKSFLDDNQRLLGELAQGAFSFIDLGSGIGKSLVHCEERFALGPGLGVELNKKRTAEAREKGLAVVEADVTELSLPRNCVKFCTMLDFLEHLHSEEDAVRIFKSLDSVVSDFIYICHPSFEEMSYLSSLGLKYDWSDWTGHRNMMTLADFERVFKSLGWNDYQIYPQKPILDSSHPSLVPLSAPKDTVRYNAKVLDPKPEVSFDRPIWTQFHIFVKLSSGVSEELWAQIISGSDPISEAPAPSASPISTFSKFGSKLSGLKSKARSIFQSKKSEPENEFLNFAPPGHFYSPLPSNEEISLRSEKIFDSPPRELPGIELNIQTQLDLLEEIRSVYPEHPFPEDHSPPKRFFLNNNEYSWGDAITLFGLFRKIRPKQVVEIGSGYSSAIMLDTDEHFLNGSTSFTFIDPHPDRFRALCAKDESKHQLLENLVQDVSLEVFSSLEEGDLLFVDSSHVAKVGSDVNYILFKILPLIRPGVFIQVHDIFYPFEYPKKWFKKGIAWNEAYMWRAFLSENSKYQILFFNDYLNKFHRDKFSGMPIFEFYAGQSLWLEKTA